MGWCQGRGVGTVCSMVKCRVVVEPPSAFPTRDSSVSVSVFGNDLCWQRTSEEAGVSEEVVVVVVMVGGWPMRVVRARQGRTGQAKQGIPRKLGTARLRSFKTFLECSIKGRQSCYKTCVKWRLNLPSFWGGRAGGERGDGRFVPRLGQERERGREGEREGEREREYVCGWMYGWVSGCVCGRTTRTARGDGTGG
ncbi:hypothetical protein LY76DRAFT_55669 [Colletotrichum caudatum]|nr:hypothetical protein LY76DRAFT_55669 [Colletotrichum caudatum]